MIIFQYASMNNSIILFQVTCSYWYTALPAENHSKRWPGSETR